MAGDLRSNRNEILALVTQAWREVPDNVAGFPADAGIVYAMTDSDRIPEAAKGKAWLRVTVQHVGNESRSVSGRRRVNRGLLVVEVFVWRANTASDNKVQLAADYIARRLKLHAGSVLFTDTAVNERPINEGFAQANVVSRFQWDEFIRSVS